MAFCYSDFTIFHYFPIFQLFFENEKTNSGILFSGKFYMENIFLGIFLTKFEARIAKNRNFGDNSFFLNEIFIVTWNGAKNFIHHLGSWKFFLSYVFGWTICGKNFSQFGRGRVYNFAHSTWNYSIININLRYFQFFYLWNCDNLQLLIYIFHLIFSMWVIVTKNRIP